MLTYWNNMYVMFNVTLIIWTFLVHTVQIFDKLTQKMTKMSIYVHFI